ncbi:hypothetical protein NQ314_013791 [Rhamnusium bicolor]|uniref:Solute carrier family 35 member F6 n=1 Tax=Rhamnusium bicolor TaxID=1586634 RepID=A0AAV8X548_9CUCU|nr:hypothetical protein NQ314_013791 [Rhamnusium bicolor]
MAWTSHQILLAVVMVITGSINTLSTNRRADGSEDVNELTKGNRNFNPLILFIPAMCDMTATSIMYIGLNLTYASSFQMFRGTIISIAFFNFAGISVTKELSATTRMVLDSIRTIVIWIFSLAFLGQKFHWLQLLGFLFLLIGMCLYNGITFSATFLKIRSFINRRRYSTMEEEIIDNRNAEDTEQ